MSAHNSIPDQTCDLAVIGMGVMGRSIALNMADHGHTVAIYDLSNDAVDRVPRENPPESFAETGGGIVPCRSVSDVARALKKPRAALVLVPAGRPTDGALDSLAEVFEQGDVLIDGGNAFWRDTACRAEAMKAKGIGFVGCGVSGGEEGARFGPSLMPGGDREAYERIRPIWEAIAAKVDAKTGKPIEGAEPRKPISAEGADTCCAYIGPEGAGHFVKMVHNGIEYADMQLIAEAYALMRHGAGFEPARISEVFSRWDQGPLDSYLVEITADILQQTDPRTGVPFVDVVLDRAGQKGTGRWTSAESLEFGVPAPTIAEAVFARAVSAIKEERVRASSILPGPSGSFDADPEAFVNDLERALLASKITAYAQGFALIRAASEDRGWNVDFGALAGIWRGGCIIRARLLEDIRAAYARDAALPSLLLDPGFVDEFTGAQDGWRRTIAHAARLGVPAPGLSSALAYYDAYRRERVPADLIQAKRDYFGAHTYERVDEPHGRHFHLNWHEDQRTEQAMGH